MAVRGKYTYEWPRPMVTVDSIVFRKAGLDTFSVLLIKRNRPPFENCWALPGGFVEMDEELADAAARELEEETALTGIRLRQFHTFGECGRDPRGRQISIVFWGIAEPGSGEQVKGGDDASEARWYKTDNLPERLSFDHSKIIDMAVNTLLSPLK